MNRRLPRDHQWQQRHMLPDAQPGYHPPAGYPWMYPLNCVPHGFMPMYSPGCGQRPTARGVQTPKTYTPIAPVKPFPPDPYINQFSLSKALQTGTLFPWLAEPDEQAGKASPSEQNGSLGK